MSTPELLARAVLQAWQRIDAVKAQAREDLTAQRDALRRAEELSTDADVLSLQQLNLANELEQLRTDIKELEGQRDDMQEELRRKLDAVWRRLVDTRGVQLEEMRARRVAADFWSAIAGFSGELEECGLDLEHATPAQLRERLPLLRAAASDVEAGARAKAELASENLSGAQELQQQSLQLQQRERDLKQELQQVVSRLRSHSRSAEQVKLVEDILVAEEGVLHRLRREILEPLLVDARLEREMGLGGDDPLAELANLCRNS